MQNSTKRHTQRMIAIIAIAVLSVLIAYLCSILPGTSTAIKKIDDAAYDAAYRMRAPEIKKDSPVVLLEVDDESLKQINELADYRWPWPRELWGMITQKLESKGAKAVAFDMFFSEKSAYGLDDDKHFAEILNEIKIPVIIGAAGLEQRFAVPTTKPTMGNVSTISENVIRRYHLGPWRYALVKNESLPLAAVKRAGYTPKIDSTDYLIHYYGPHRTTSGESVIPAYQASRIALEAIDDKFPENLRLKSDLFKDKIVVIGCTAASLYDLKGTPWSEKYPGAEVQATVINNLIEGKQVHAISGSIQMMIELIGVLVIACGVILVRSALIKILCIAAVVILLIFMASYLMQQPTMHWLAITQPMLAIILATIASLIWTYRIEDAHARFLLKALSQCISPEIAKELSTDPSQLAVGGKKQLMTVLFSDLEGFTKLAETIGERIEPVLNHYLGEMSQQILDRNGTIDKFIGDAVMAFWNAPIAQPDHARLACEAALAMIKREKELAPVLAELGAGSHRMYTRIGINTGEPVVGFYGSSQRLSYTAVGDTVNLAARLEPSNKIYNTQIIASRETVQACGDSMLFRPIDRLLVVGRREPVGVYELMCSKKDAGPEQIWLAEQSQQAAMEYLHRNWQQCREIVVKILEKFPTDGPAKVWLSRVEAYIQSPPPSDWDGVYESKSK